MTDADRPDIVISALLPVHAGVDAGHLAATLDTVLAQDRSADEIVVVEDGPLGADQLALLDRLEQDHPRVVRVRLPVNRGAGVANGEGLLAASGTWIAKVDADDLNVPHRFRVQLDAVTSSGADVCGAAMLEFEDTPDHVVARRTAPAGHDAIARRMRSNNPVNHPTAFYRRELAVAVGGYPDFRFMQDYVLFARMLQGGARMMNLPEALVLFRTGDLLRSRRSHPDYTRLELRLQRELHALGVVRRSRRLVNTGWRLLYRRMPPGVMRWVNRQVLSSPNPGPSSTLTDTHAGEDR